MRKGVASPGMTVDRHNLATHRAAAQEASVMANMAVPGCPGKKAAMSRKKTGILAPQAMNGAHRMVASATRTISPRRASSRRMKSVRLKAEGAGPSRDWLGFVVSSRARQKIRQHFSRERRDEAMEHGKETIIFGAEPGFSVALRNSADYVIVLRNGQYVPE